MIIFGENINKRTILALIITVVTIVIANKYWFIIEPLPIHFDISGRGKCNIEVQLNKNDDSTFKKIKTKTIVINLDKKNHADIFVNRAKYPKRIKLIFSNLSSKAPIKISNFQFRYGKYTLHNIEKFKVDGAKVKVQDNSLILIPNNNEIILTYPDTLHIRASMNFDFMLFSIILILTYLLTYKLTDYIADFKTIKGKSRIDIIFLTIFFILLFIPMSHINNDEISEQENRTLAKWQPLINKDNKINFEFGKNFNDWFNDRFNLRQTLVGISPSLSMLIENKYNDGFFDMTNKTLYHNTDFTHKDIAAIKIDFKALYDFNDWCEKHNIKLYILIVPTRADIHTSRYKYLNDEYKHKDFLHYISDINKENKIKVIYPYKEMLYAANMGKQLYFKTEHHWTDDGAFIGYQALMKKIIKDFPDVKILTSDDYNIFQSKKVRGDFSRTFHYGTHCRKIGVSDLICDMYHKYDYDYYKHKDFDNLKKNITDEKYHLNKIYTYINGANYRVMQLGTSQNENLTEFIPFTFKNVKLLRNNGVKGISKDDAFKIMKYYEKEILDYKPDIIVFCITYKNIGKLHYLFNME